MARHRHTLWPQIRNWQALVDDAAAVERISNEIDSARESVLHVLTRLR